MAAPRYMRFFPDLYLNDTATLTPEEQGVYMRILCLMWRHGGKIPAKDSTLARMIGIHVNKWAKVKPNIMGYLKEHSPGYLTQNRLSHEYKYSQGKSKVTNRDSEDNTNGVSQGVTPQVAADKLLGNNSSQNQKRPRDVDELVSDLTQKFSGSFDQSKSKSENKNYNRLDLDDAREKNCGKLITQSDVDSFLKAIQRVFNAFEMQPPTDYEVIRSWLENGIDPDRHIIPTIREILKRIEGSKIDPPKSWRYFAKEIYQAAQIQKQRG